MVRITLYTVEEANRAAAEMRPLLERLIAAKREFDELGTRLDVLALALAGASAENPDRREVRRLNERRRERGPHLTPGRQAIHARGCVIKDLERGLVDFYAVLGDRLIFLCWHVGEPEVAHWHSLQDGFAGRQPLDRLEME